MLDSFHTSPPQWEQVAAKLKASEAAKAPRAGEMDDVFRYTYPHRQIYRTRNTEADRKKIYDTTATESIRALATYTQRYLIPQNSPWAMLEWTTPQLRSEFGAHFGQWVEQVNAKIHANWQESNFYIALEEALIDAITAGTGCMAIVDDGSPTLGYMSVSLSELYILLDYRGNARDVFRVVELTQQQIEERWNIMLPDRDASNPERTMEVVECEMREVVFVPANKKRVVEYSYSVWSRSSGTLLHHQRSPFQTFFVFFWDRSPKQIWGEGPGLQALPDIRSVNLMIQDLLTRSAFEARGMWQTSDETINEKQLCGRLKPGQVVKTRDPLVPVPFPGNFTVTIESIMNCRNQIRALFYNNALNPDPSKPTYQPATEVAFRRELFAAGVGQGPAKRIDAQLLLPIADMSFRRMVERGDIVPPTLEDLNAIGIPALHWDEVWRIGVHAAVARAQEMAQATTNLQGYASLVQMIGDPQIVSKHFDIDKLIRTTAEKMGVDPSVMRSMQEVRKIEALQRDQQQMLQAMSVVQAMNNQSNSTSS